MKTFFLSIGIACVGFSQTATAQRTDFADYRERAAEERLKFLEAQAHALNDKMHRIEQSLSAIGRRRTNEGSVRLEPKRDFDSTIRQVAYQWAVDQGFVGFALTNATGATGIGRSLRRSFLSGNYDCVYAYTGTGQRRLRLWADVWGRRIWYCVD